MFRFNKNVSKFAAKTRYRGSKNINPFPADP